MIIIVTMKHLCAGIFWRTLRPTVSSTSVSRWWQRRRKWAHSPSPQKPSYSSRRCDGLRPRARVRLGYGGGWLYGESKVPILVNTRRNSATRALPIRSGQVTLFRLIRCNSVRHLEISGTYLLNLAHRTSLLPIDSTFYLILTAEKPNILLARDCDTLPTYLTFIIFQ